ncbi:hypothetical protein NUH16_003370 [Penicillium rubens]|nr:hypothetical protein NUH16_003370 [Penicillium rubens]
MTDNESKGPRKQSPNYDVSLRNNKGSEKQQGAARGKNGDSNPHTVLAFSIAVISLSERPELSRTDLTTQGEATDPVNRLCPQRIVLF